MRTIAGRLRAVGGVLPRGMLGMLALILGAELFVAQRDRTFLHIWAWDWRLTSRAAGREALRSEVLCFGDSLVKFSLLPEVLEARTGRPAFNLSLSAGSPAATYYLFRRVLKDGARPGAVLVNFAPHSLSHEPGRLESLWPELLDVRDSLDLARSEREARLFAVTLLGRLPTVSGRQTIRARAIAALRGETSLDRLVARRYIRDHARLRGAHAAAEDDYRADDAHQFAEDLYPAAWRLRPENLRYVRRFLDLAASRNIRVFLVIPPFVPEVHARRDRQGLDALYTQFAGRLQSRYANLTVIDARRSGYDRSTHVDPLHLNARGAACFSSAVAEVIVAASSRLRTRSRWYDLPPYRPPAPADATRLAEALRPQARH